MTIVTDSPADVQGMIVEATMLDSRCGPGCAAADDLLAAPRVEVVAHV
jgi:hypothetical protein